MSHAGSPLSARRRPRVTASVVVLTLFASSLALIAGAASGARADTAPLSVKVNFQPTATATPAGFSKDIGAAYDSAAGSGWVREDSLSGTHVPFGIQLNTRDRTACTSLTPQQRTFIHMQAPTTTSTNNSTKVAWEYSVPNGSYRVTVGAGDANAGSDAEVQNVNVEGVNVINKVAMPTGTTACVASRMLTGSTYVDVVDGRLTVDALGGTNTKLQYVTIDNAADRVGPVTATPGASSISLDWADAPAAVSYRVFRSSNLPVSFLATPYATPAGSDFADTAVVKGKVYYYAVQAVTATGVTSAPVMAGAMVDDPAPAVAPMPMKVNFSKAGGTAVAGYVTDSGQNFANVRGYGWVEPGTQNPLNLDLNGRERSDSTIDPRLNSLVHMQYPATASTASGYSSPGSWELAVPNGSYDVELAVGDATPGSDPTDHVINVEGVNAVNHFPVTSTTVGAARFKSAALTVPVGDGRLTIDALGGTNTKIDYVTVTPTPADAAPAAPTGVTATAGDATVGLEWADSTEPDLTGYDVYRSTNATVPTTGTPLNGATPLTASAFTDTTVANDTTYRYVVVAVDAAGTRSAASAVVTATPDAVAPPLTTLPLKVNFANEGAEVVPGYVTDFGQPFSNTRGSGWVVPGTSTPLSLIGNGRTRDVRTGNSATLLQRTIIHAQGNNLATPMAGPGAWEVSVPAGRYVVTVSAGDQPGATKAGCATPCYDSQHTVRVEGTTAIGSFQATAGEEFRAATVTVEVTDGRLTLDTNGGFNTKVNYVEVSASDVTAPGAPALRSTPGDGAVALIWDAVDAPDLAGYRLYRSLTTPVATSPANRVTEQTGTSYVDGALTNGTAYHYVLTAVDTAGNESGASNEEVATPVDTTAPTAPESLTASGDIRSVVLRWIAPAGGDVAGYRVYASASAAVVRDPGHLVGSPTEPGFTEEDLPNDVTRYYVVTAIDAAGNESAPSAVREATPTAAPDLTAPAAPLGLEATAGDGRVSLSWNTSAESDLAGYEVYRSAVGGGQRTRLTPDPLSGTSYVDLSAANGTTYFYVVTALDLAGNESAVSVEASAKPVDSTPPLVPPALTATPGANSVILRWGLSPDADLLRYRIYRGSSGGFVLDDDSLLGTVRKAAGRAWLDSDLEAGTTYYYKVTSEDVVGNESAPATAAGVPTAAPDTTAPDAPTGLVAAEASGQVTLTWGAVTASDRQGYNVYRADTSGGVRTKLTATPVTGTTYVDPGVPGGDWFYVVTTVDTSNNESGVSNEVTAVVLLSDLTVRVDFTTAAAPALAGHLTDTGAAYTTARGSGWIREDSLSSATRTPLDMTANTRLRTRTAVDARLNNMVHMHYGDVLPTPTTNGTLVPGAWEYGLPNGRYTVTVSVGDQPGGTKAGCPAPCYDSVHTVHAEGVTAVNAFQATAAAEYRQGTVTVDVTDGKLTIDALGGSNTKLNYVDIVSSGAVEPDTTAPGAPTSLTVTGGNNSAQLSWGAPAAADVAGYDVYRSTSPTVVVSSANRVTAGPVTGLNFTDTSVLNGTRYYYVVTAVDTSGNVSEASAPGDVVPAPVTGFNAKVNFQDAATTAPSGYLPDWGQAFGARTEPGQGSGNTYGWVSVGSSTPLSLVGNGRNRNTGSPAAGQPDLRLATFLHMQYPAGSTQGVATPGSWEMAVPNGAYTVTVAVGDAGTAVDSSNWINIENQNALAAVVPTATTKFATATRTVVVSDGRLSLSPAGGSNTKIDYVDLSSLDASGRPYPTAVHPTNGETNVVANASVTTDNSLNAETGAVNEASLLTSVSLSRVADGVRVPGHGATSGGGDTISFQADAPLAPGTLYRFSISSGATDNSGRAFVPFSSVFTTATGGGTGQPPGSANAAFDKLASGASAGKSYTSLVMGPDGKLYAGSIYGQIYRWTVNADGTLSNEQVINTVRTHASARGWEGAPNRTIIGLAFDPASTADNPILWITDNYAYLGAEVPDATGAVARLTGANLENYEEVVVNLPRSIKDHETNSIAFHAGKAYIIQGSMNAMGASEGTWKKEEHLLSAAILQLDPAKLPASLPLDAATPDLAVPARGGVPAHLGTYDPYAATAPLTFYATGIRNGYDLVWHSNGHLYTGVNGSAAGGATPKTPTTLPASCATRPDGPYTGPAVPEIRPNNQAETDYIFDIREGKYYGHPNPMRCEFVLNAGNPAGYAGNPLFKVNGYPLGTASDPNYDLAHVFDAGLHASANGAIEYKNTAAFGGAFAGKLVVVRYSANQEIVAFDVASGTSVSTAVTGIAGFTGHRQPLDVTEDVSKGNLYVSQLTDDPATTGIVLLKPQGGTGPAAGSAQVTPRLVFTDVKGGAASAAQNIAVRNAGNGPLVISAAGVTGPDAGLFASTLPALPVTVAPGATLNVPVTFAPTAAGPRGATLTLTTDDPQAATIPVTLRGLGTDGQGGALEPSLQWILDTLQIPVNVGDPNSTNNDLPAGAAPIGDEVLVSSFTKAAFDHAVTVEPISLFGPAGPAANPYVVTAGVHTTGTPAERTLLFRGPNTANQTVLPAVTSLGEYDLETPFGFDFTWHGLSDRVAFSEDGLNTWDPSNPHKVRVFPLKNADGSLEPNAYVIAPEDVLSPVDFQDAALIVRNVRPAATAGLGKATPSASELVFSGVKSTTSAVQTLTVTNTGSTPLAITGASLTGANATSFTMTGDARTVAPNGTAAFDVRFTPGATPLGSLSAALHLVTDSATTPTVDIGLFGLATNAEQGNDEPPLKAVVDTLGRPVNVGGTGLILGTSAAPIGDEVVAPLFVKSGTGPVTMKPVARYSPDELLPFGWYAPNSGDAVAHEIATIALDQEQTLNPRIVLGGQSTFDPGTGSFGFYVDSRTFGRKTYTQDGINTATPHGARTYPARDRSGAALPNTYLVAFEDASNGDYQDYVFEVAGVRPASGGTSTVPAGRFDFQPAASTVAAGYTADAGAPFNATTGVGWVQPGTATPLDMTALTRDRAGTEDARLRTLILMQPTAAQSAAGPGAWEYAVPNGTYVVTVSVGDVLFTDSVHRVSVEGQVAIAGFAPTSGEMSRTATVTVPVSDGRLTIDALGGTNTKLQYVDVDRVTTGVDATAPTVALTVNGLRNAAGAYKNSATVTVSASDLGSGVASTSYSLNGAAFLPYSTPVEVAAPGSYTVRARAQDVAGNVATSTTTTFTVVAAGVSTANVVVENLDGVPFNDRLAMSRIQTPETGTRCKDPAACDPVTGPFFPINAVHDVSVLRIRNTGTDALNVTGLPVTGPFALVNTLALPAVVPAGGSLDVPVRFTASTAGAAAGLWSGTLTVVSDDADQGSLPVELSGFWQSQSENNQEPSVTEIARTFGYTTAITSGGTPLNQDGLVHPSGEEVLSPYWTRANAAVPVSVRQLAAYHTQGNTATVSWHVKGSNAPIVPSIVTHLGVEGQTILPHRNGSTTVVASGTFAPAGPFGFKIDGEWSDDTKNDQAADITNGCTGPCGHHMRFWPVRDRSGAVVAGSYLMSMDYSGINYDYNDNVYLVTNIKPELAADPSAGAPLPGNSSLALGFDTAYPGTLVDRDGQTTGFRTTQRNRLDSTNTASSSYTAGLVDIATAAPGTLAVESSGTSTTGSNSGGDNTLVNGLRNLFDSSADDFSLTGRLVGPVTMLDAGSEQEGVMFGPDQDNFVKVVAINRSGVPGLEFYAEQGGTGSTVGTAALPAGVSALDLALLGDPSTRTVRAAYRVNDGTWTVLPNVLTLPAATAGRFFDRSVGGGLLVSHKGGAPFTATYDSFAVTPGDVTGAPTAAREALFRFDVAGSGNYTDTAGQVWTPDTGRFSPATAIVEGASTTQEIAGTADDVLYRTYRGNVGNVPQDQRVLSYSLPTGAATTVDLRLHFAERAAGNNTLGKRLIDITAEGRTLRSGFDIYAAAGALNTATVLSFKNVAVQDGRLDLAFRATVDYPSIAAIEVLCAGACPVDTTAPSAPTGLTAVAGAGGVTLDWTDNGATDLAGYDVYRSDSPTGTFTRVTTAPVAGSSYIDTSAPAASSVSYRVTASDFAGNESVPSAVASVTTPAPPVQQPIRINTGGPAQTVGSTTWSACSSVTVCSGWVSGGTAYAEADTITGIPAGMNNTLFRTEWTGGAAAGARAFGYDVPVVNGRYQVHLHFAELNKTAAGARLFSVNLEGTRVLTNLDVFAAAGGIDRAIVRSFTTNVTDGKVTIDFLAGVENAKISAIEILPVDTTAPGAVTGVTATASESGVALTWAASSAADLAGYDVYRSASETGTFTKLNTARLTSAAYSDTAAPAGTTSFYRVLAVDTADNASSPSVPVSATRPEDTTAPGVVTGVSAAGVAAGVSLSWTANTAADLAGYSVYRATSPTGTYALLAPAVVTGTTFLDSTAPAGTAFSYQVTALDRTGNESVRSAVVTATRPTSVQGPIRINAGGPAVTTGGVSWQADSFSNGGKTYSNARVTAIAGTTDDVLYLTERSATTNGGGFGYAVPVANGTYDVRLHFAEIYWGATGGGAGGTGKRVFSANLEGGPVELANLDLNAVAAPMTSVIRSYRVSVTDGTMDLAFTSSVNQAKLSALEILPADAVAPAPVTGVTAAGVATGVTLGWTAGADADLAGYNVYRSTTAAGSYSKVNTAPITATSFTDTSAPAGTVTSYQVTAVDRSNNESARSATVTATRPVPAQSAVRINVGGPAQTVGTTSWSACSAVANCSGWVSGGFAYSEADTISGIPAGLNQTIFQSEWTGGVTGAGPVPAGQRAFGFDVPVANGAYRVRLHFAELNKIRAGQRTFDVRLEGTTVLTAFDIFAAAGGIDRVVTREFPVTVTDGRVTLEFLRRVENAKVSAIEILPAT